MRGHDWLDAIAAVVAERSLAVEASRPDPDTLGFTNGLRGAIIHSTDAAGYLTLSIAHGGSIADRLKKRVEHLPPEIISIESATIATTAAKTLAHLNA